MMKKNIKNTVLLSASLFLGAITLSSCENKIFEDPYENMSPEDAFSNAGRIENAAVGMYDKLQNAEFLGGRVLIYADIRGVDALASTYFGQMINYNTLQSGDQTTTLAWQGAYRSIFEANYFLKNFAKNTDKVSAAKAAQYVGEAKFIRSLNYFYLVNLWAQPYSFTADASHLGVPLILEDFPNDPLSPENQKPRSTVAEVYAQIEKDLLDAEIKLPEAALTPVGSEQKFENVARATKSAARAFLMRLYLYKGDYIKANEYADKIIATGNYLLSGTPDVPFKSFTTKESIFSVAMNGADNPNTNNAMGQHYSPDNRKDITVNVDYLKLMDTTVDLRYKNLVVKKSGAFWTTKFFSTDNWVPIFRYSEVLLTKAEALANINSSSVDNNAVVLLNQVRARSKAAVVTPNTNDELKDLIAKERRIELAFEGQGIMEFLRKGKDIPPHGLITTTQKWGSDYVVLPIPFYDIQKNTKLIQNKGY